ncbi:ribbon-helix-helix domain-containing protein [Tardiphaga sp. 604_B6_N1_1]|uniref:ribbon-helix-helix domain-containing protein n=1 Tax=unclassified Tardiphaga TaxID=2631404 RepID=UPI003F204909
MRHRTRGGRPLRASERSLVMKRGIVVGGHRTSASLEGAFWDGLKEIAEVKGLAVSDLL